MHSNVISLVELVPDSIEDMFHPLFMESGGAGKEARTPDIFLGKEVLYQLSYTRMYFVSEEVFYSNTYEKKLTSPLLSA